MKRTLGCVGCLVLCAAAGAWAAGPLAPAELKCEYRVDPAGIGETAPRLTWILTGEGRGLYQAAYQILAADSEAAPSLQRLMNACVPSAIMCCSSPPREPRWSI